MYNAKHSEETHGIDILSYQEIWADIRRFYLDQLKKTNYRKGFGKLKRKDFKDRWEER